MAKRNDGRKETELRPLKITRNYIKYAEGSCLIELGNTKVICTATVEETVPQFLRDTGTGWVSAEYGMIPRSCSVRVPRNKNSGRTFEIQRLVGRSLRAVTDMKELGPRTVWIDCDVIQADGGTRTASITGSFIALADALNRIYKSGVINKIPLKDYVAATSIGIVDGTPLLDLAYEEDVRAEVDMNIVMTADGEFIEIQGTAERETFDKTQMNMLLELAEKGIKELVSYQKKLLKDIAWEEM
ncbi:MAG: ribonuclease PH [Candidatus Omnitrophica bacterium]|nr:ribonuclease PH [Candidatus Omnitrophota bacterium]MDD5236252.1 ribonuclease PH [Candidatus Omnitrophota bacterium]MDD5611038.1 ribonuclease PH [Candidatus Omnitrophota bacterium]